MIEKWRIQIQNKNLFRHLRYSIVMEMGWFLLLSWDMWWPTWDRNWLTNRSTRWLEKPTSMETDTSTMNNLSEWWWQDDKWFKKCLILISINWKLNKITTIMQGLCLLFLILSSPPLKVSTKTLHCFEGVHLFSQKNISLRN